MAGESVKEQILLLVEILEAFSEFIARVGNIEKKGFLVSKISDPNYLSEMWKKIFSELDKDQFVAIMGLWFELGRFTTVDIWSLSPDEKIKLASVIGDVARQVKEILRR